ncbi:Ras-specific guanine nucleotide-releasing factor 2 [Goodea atripinnis]|uniref:Ras-specific guanine nucleotide-releasing factor 2 n=1 Tax=Goodea atripinnis TaxID=208336 RepID=A0ABV0NIJ5_9TELE
MILMLRYPHIKLTCLCVIKAESPKAECFESLSAMEMAEQITLLDHIVFRSIPYEITRKPLFMNLAPQMSNLVASQIMTHTDVGSRASSIEKWLAVADICRCLNNYNGVLEITSALNRSAIYRLKKTWAKVCKQVYILLLNRLITVAPTYSTLCTKL